MYGKTLCLHNDNRLKRQHDRQRGSVELTVVDSHQARSGQHVGGTLLQAVKFDDATEIVDDSEGEFPGAAGESLTNQLVRDRHNTATNRSSRYKSNQYTEYTPNFLKMGREVRTPANIVNSSPEAPLNNAFDRYADELLHRLKRAYQSAIQHLKAAADRTKRNFDIRIWHRKYRVGDWVHHCNPRKEVGCQDKWRRKFSGPFLIVAIPGAVNVMLQRS